MSSKVQGWFCAGSEFVLLSVAVFLFAFLASAGSAADILVENPNVQEEPLCLDITKFNFEPNSQTDVLAALYGQRFFDGLPFNITGQARLFGQTPALRNDGDHPNMFKGIRIDRAFDELHLLHYTSWPDAEQQPVAYICLNYKDGDKFIFSIRYGAHVRDWFRLPSEEKELLTDADTKVVWRRSPVAFKAPIRVFKSRLVNPFPKKTVDTMDVVSARNLACYNLIAATVAKQPLPPPETNVTPERVFDGSLTIRVVDAATGLPIAGALVEPAMRVDDEGVVASPFYTSSAGEGSVRYPVKLTAHLCASVKKEGYAPQSESWSGSFPKSFTFRLVAKGGNR